MKILIVEPNGSGHHMALYVRHLVRKLIAEKCEVSLLTTRTAVGHPSFQLLAGEHEKINILFLPELPIKDGHTSWKLFKHQTKCWFILRREFAKIQLKSDFDIVYVPTMDWMAKAMELLGSPFGSCPFVALYMSPKHHRKAMGLGPASRQDWLYKNMFKRLLRIQTLRSVLVIDEFFHEYCKLEYGQLAQKLEYVPDFGEIRGIGTKGECRASLGICSKSKVLLVYGSLTKRKGIVQLLEALDHPSCPPEITVVLAGKTDNEIESFLATASIRKLISEGRIIPRLFFHDDTDEYRVLKAADFVWLGYVEGFYGSSGVLFQALQAGVPLVAMEQGLIGRIVKKYMLGVVVNPMEVDSILQGLATIITKHFVSVSVEHNALQSFGKSHTAEEHSTLVFRNLCKEKAL